MLKQIDHDNVVKVFEDEDVEAHGTLYIPMAYYHGSEPLNARLGPQGTLDEADIRQHILPIMDGLEAVHRGGVLHRDITPSNILLVSDGTGVLIDFGSARPRNLAESGDVTMVHTPSYAAFEQRVMGASESAATDIYGLGAVLYRCVTGQRPWDPLRRADDDRMPRAGDAGRAGRYSRELLRMIDAALAVKPNDRPQSVAEWRRILATESVRARGGGTSRADRDSARCSPPAIDTGDVSGIDPELMTAGAVLAVFHIEAGARSFGDFAGAMARDLGELFEPLKPYLRNFYNGARDWPGTDYSADMSTPDEITAWYEGGSDADATQTGGLGDVWSDTDRTEPAGGGEAQQGRDVEDNADYQYVRGLLAHHEDDWEEAESWYMRAAEQNHPKAQFDLGMMYFRGEIEGLDIGEDVQHAVSYCMDAAANGLDGAKAFLGRDIQAGLEAYRRGDHHQAELEFRRLAEIYSVHQALREPSHVLGRECGEAQFMLAQMCVHGTNSADFDNREAFDQAAEWLRGAARNGCGRAESWLYGLLGGHARWRLSVEQTDLEDLGAEGLDWYWKAAERTPAEQYDLGLRSEGDPDHACCEEASFWYRLAAEQGYVEAQFRLGLLTYCGVDGWHLEDSWIFDFDAPVRDLANVMLGSLPSEPSGPHSGGSRRPLTNASMARGGCVRQRATATRRQGR